VADPAPRGTVASQGAITRRMVVAKPAAPAAKASSPKKTQTPQPVGVGSNGQGQGKSDDDFFEEF